MGPGSEIENTNIQSLSKENKLTEEVIKNGEELDQKSVVEPKGQVSRRRVSVLFLTMLRFFTQSSLISTY
jgi:hypothetical protein